MKGLRAVLNHIADDIPTLVKASTLSVLQKVCRDRLKKIVMSQ